MKIEYFRNRELAKARIWLNDNPDVDTESRQDSVVLELHTTTCACVGVGLADLGMPVLQPKQVRLVPEPALANSILQLESREEAFKCVVTVLGLSALAVISGLPLECEPVGDSPPRGIGNEAIEAFNTFLALTGEESPAQSMRTAPGAEAVTVSPHHAEVALNMGLWRRDGNRLIIGNRLSVSGAGPVSALLAVDIMSDIWPTYGVEPSARFARIHQASARDALRAVATPTAADVTFFGDRDCSTHK